MKASSSGESMSFAVRRSLRMLSKRDRRILGLVTGAQMTTAVLDLAGVLLLGLVTTLAVASSMGTPLPASLGSILDRLGIQVGSGSAILVLAAAAGVLLILKSAISIYLNRRALRFLAHRQAAVSGALIAGLLSRPLIQIQLRPSQETAYALTDGVMKAILIVLGQGIVTVTEVALLTLLALGMLFVSPIVTVFAVVFFGAVAFILHRLMSDWAGRLGAESATVGVASYAVVQESIHTYREIFVADRRSHYVDRFQRFRWRAADAEADLQFIGLAPKYVFEVTLIVGAGVLAASQFMTKGFADALGIIVVFLAAGSRIVPSILRLQAASLSVRSAAGQARPTYELADELDAIESPRPTSSERPSAGRTSLPEPTGGDAFRPDISIFQACVQYPGAGNLAIDHVSLEVEAGQSLALVGTTGAGKSTLADAILGVMPLASGNVTIGGLEPLAAITRWPGQVAYVPQEVALTNGTIRENVALGLPPQLIDDKSVWDALERAHLAEYLRESRDGLDTLIGEMGLRLSGGQRQRLGMARALYTRPKLLVLDEATSALDSETEEAITRTLSELEGQVTTVTVAHRLATIRNCDIIVFLESGRLAAKGSFDEVRGASPQFDHQAKLLGL